MNTLDNIISCDPIFNISLNDICQENLENQPIQSINTTQMSTNTGIEETDNSLVNKINELIGKSKFKSITDEHNITSWRIDIIDLIGSYMMEK